MVDSSFLTSDFPKHIAVNNSENALSKCLGPIQRMTKARNFLVIKELKGLENPSSGHAFINGHFVILLV